MITPCAGSRPNSRAESSHDPRRCPSQRFRFSSPPTSAMLSEASTKSSISERLSSDFFISKTSVTISGHSAYRVTSACEMARSASSSVSPRRFSAIVSSPAASSFLCSVCVFETRNRVSSIICRKRCRSGKGRSKISTRLRSSGGISIFGAVRIIVFRLAENRCPTSRRRRTTTGSSMWRCRSLRINAASIETPSRFPNICAGSRLL